MCMLHKRMLKKEKNVKIPLGNGRKGAETGLAVHICVHGVVQNYKRRRGDLGSLHNSGEENMATAILVGTFMLLLEISIFVMKVFLKVLSYMLVFMITFVVYAVSFMLNVFTVPLIIVVHVAQKHCGGQLPYVGRRLLLFYPTFNDPKWTETSRQDGRATGEPIKVLVVHSDNGVDDPLFWSY